MAMLCPFCQHDVEAFPPAADGAGLACPVCKEEGIPILYPREYDRHPAVPLSIFGPTGHGKTVFIDALVTQLERAERWPGFSCQWMDEAAMRDVRTRLRQLRELGALPDFTPSIFPRPQVLRLRSVPRVGGCQLLFYDTGGETFTSAELLRENGRYLKNSPAVVWLVSLTDLEYPEQLSDLMTTYAQAMAEMGADTRRQSLVLTLTKGDLLIDHPGFPESAQAFLTNDALDPAGEGWAKLEAVSDDLEQWLLASDHRNVMNLLKGQFGSVRVCVLSAQGMGAQDQMLVMDLMPRGVLAPLLWVWRHSLPAVWVETGTARSLHFSPQDAIRSAPAGATVRLEPRTYHLGNRLEVSRPLTILGPGPDECRLTCGERGFVVGVRASGKVVVHGVTLEHVGTEPADILRVFAGEAVLFNCRLRGGVTLLPTAPGDGVLASEVGTATLTRCTISQNQGCGVSSQKQSRVSLKNCQVGPNGWVGVSLAGTAAEVTDCVIEESSFHGISVAKAVEVAIVGSTIRKSKKSGMAATGQATIVLQRNTFQANGQNGIEVTETVTVTAHENVSATNGQAGILVAGSARGVVRGNKFQRNGRAGVAIEDQAQPELEGNRCEQNTGFGIIYTGTSTGSCIDNVCDRNKGDGLKIAGRATPTVDGNSCSENEKVGIVVTGTAAPFLGKRNVAGGNAGGDYDPPKSAKKGWFT